MSKFAGAALIGAVTSVAAYFSPAVREFIARWTAIDAPGGGWRILAIVLALANLKHLPFAWHARFFQAFFYQLYFQPTSIPPHALFQPIKTSSRCSLFEVDYNIHKSNSTYFTDMDVTRTHLFTAVVRNAIRKEGRRSGKKKELEAAGASQGTKGKHFIALGGLACNFKKEIKPYQKYEMWTRVLSWDRKWFYLVTHLVKPGVAKPKGWTLQPWKKTKGAEVDAETLKGAIFASSISKYVVKNGRRTVSPEQVLIDAGMVPPKPEGWEFKGTVDAGDFNGSILPNKSGEEWNWDVIEAERLRGWKLSENFAALDGLHDVFDGGNNGALGEYTDI